MRPTGRSRHNPPRSHLHVGGAFLVVDVHSLPFSGFETDRCRSTQATLSVAISSSEQRVRLPC